MMKSLTNLLKSILALKVFNFSSGLNIADIIFILHFYIIALIVFLISIVIFGIYILLYSNSSTIAMVVLLFGIIDFYLFVRALAYYEKIKIKK